MSQRVFATIPSKSPTDYLSDKYPKNKSSRVLKKISVGVSPEIMVWDFFSNISMDFFRFISYKDSFITPSNMKIFQGFLQIFLKILPRILPGSPLRKPSIFPSQLFFRDSFWNSSKKISNDFFRNASRFWTKIIPFLLRIQYIFFP